MKIFNRAEEKNNLQNLFNPASVAIVGASNKKGKIGTLIAENVSKLGYKGAIYMVNPSYKILGLKRCYPSLSAIKKNVDVAIICVPAKFVMDVIKDGIGNVKNYVIISAGFSEIGSEGAKREKELFDLAKKHKLNILGPNCLGFMTPAIKLNASFAAGMPQAGNVAFVSQSGALMAALLDKAEEEHLGFSNVISIGNQTQINESKILEYLADDESTKVIGMYLEGIKNGSRFLETAKKVSHKKPIIILKAGKTAKAQQAISSHTGALAGSDEIVEAAFESANIIRADGLENFFDLLSLVSFMDAPKNNQVAVITNAGGAGVLTTDSFKNKEIALAEFEQETKRNLAKQLPGESSVQNPVDLLGDAGADRYQNILKLLEKENHGSVICVLTPQQQTPVEKVAEVIISAVEKKNKTAMLAVFIGGDRVKKSVSCLKKNNIPTFINPENAVRALDQYCKWNIARAAVKEDNMRKILSDRKNKVEEIISAAKNQERKALFFSEAAEIMNMYGISCIKSFDILPDAEIPEIEKYPVAVKIDSDKILHKSDKQALLLDIKDKKELHSAIQKLRNNFPGERIIIQEMQNKSAEIILGIKKDEVFGPVIVYGLGGIYTEIFKMVDFLIPPMDSESIKDRILKGRLSFLFEGVRGQAAYNADEFADIISGLMDFTLENTQLKEFDINPMFIYNDGRRALAADVKIIF